MPRGGPPQWKQRIEPILDAHVQASIAGGMDQDTGHHAELLYTGIADSDRALRIKRNLFNSARLLGVSMRAAIERNGTEYRVRFNAVNKRMARMHILKTYGPDRANWPYDPRRKGN